MRSLKRTADAPSDVAGQCLLPRSRIDLRFGLRACWRKSTYIEKRQWSVLARPNDRADAVPSVATLADATVHLLSQGQLASTVMREKLAPTYRIVAEDKKWPRFVNNHAWALVGLQRQGVIRKVVPGVYALTGSQDRAPDDRPEPCPPIEADPTAPLPGWARRMVAAANNKNHQRWNGETFTDDDLRAL